MLQYNMQVKERSRHVQLNTKNEMIQTEVFVELTVRLARDQAAREV